MNVQEQRHYDVRVVFQFSFRQKDNSVRTQELL